MANFITKSDFRIHSKQMLIEFIIEPYGRCYRPGCYQVHMMDNGELRLFWSLGLLAKEYASVVTKLSQEKDLPIRDAFNDEELKDVCQSTCPVLSRALTEDENTMLKTVLAMNIPLKTKQYVRVRDCGSFRATIIKDKKMYSVEGHRVLKKEWTSLVELINMITKNCGTDEINMNKLFIQSEPTPVVDVRKNAIMGLAIGDALGVPYEFEERGSFECKDMIGFGSHDQPLGTWSDDTSMTIATLKSIIDNNFSVNVDSIREYFLSWLNNGEFTVDGVVFDVGHTTLKALMTGEPRMGEYENGNGSLMRILPLAFSFVSDDEIRAVSSITHGHWISTEACVIYVHIANDLLMGGNLEEVLSNGKYPEPFDRLKNLKQLKESEIRSSGYVVDTLEAALWALLNSNSYEEAVLKAINLGEDTDTVGAVTGGLAGIIYGLESDTCKEWYKKLRGKDVILECFE